ncbi:transmembrane protein 181 isoform X2 [Lingula anatina]|uniref:Transmembrane protein 181 isoform X2 n=1 Tax=Lingula anatina TaxID=7574 RepID=A0A1S3JCB4_LINAN|nr:transmembrane protein 181 isoform X2 [Lingula anatina]|eukprot:XP_013408050.1 transmembrane protein 181 isoform X2 [Lingula anatina]
MIPEIEASVQMRLYTLNKRQFVLVFAAFFLCFLLTVFIGLAGPSVIETSETSAADLNPKPNLQTGPFILPSSLMSTFHQQLWLIAQIQINSTGDVEVHTSSPFMVGVRIAGLKSHGVKDLLLDGTMHNRSRELKCTGQTCDELNMLHLGYLDYSRYVVTIYFFGLEKQKVLQIRDVKFQFKSYNPTFTQIEIWFRFVFLLITFLATCAFAHSLRRFTVRDWSMEQKWMSVLMPLLLLYNNPFFPLTFLVESWIPGMFDAIFQASFLCGLLLFWLCLYHGVRQTKRHFCSFYLPKLVVVGLIWISAVTLASWQAYNELQDPTYNYSLDTANYLGFQVFFYTIGVVYLLYLIFLLIRAYAELKSMPFFDLRLKFMTTLMLIVLAITVAITALRFGTNISQDAVVTGSSIHYQSSAEFLSFYGLLNFYLYTMAFVYSPSKNALVESHFRDNPALSMLNDSDEDIVYGSEYEETALNGRPTKPTRDSR